MKRFGTIAPRGITRRQFGAVGSLSVFAAAAGLPRRTSAATPALIDAANKEGRVVVYGDSTMVPFLADGFARQYPDIRVATVPGSSWQTYNRFASEQSAGRTLADVLVGGDDSLLTADRAGFLAPYMPGDAAGEPRSLRPAQANYLIPQGMFTPMLYNKDALAGHKLPQDWSDIATLGPEWRGLIVQADPRGSGTALAVLTALYVHLGPERAGKIVAALRTLEAEIAPTSGVQVSKVLSGERPLSISLHMGFYQQMRDKGAPVDTIMATSGSSMQHGGIGVTKAAPHPNAGRLFLDFATGPAGAAIYASQGCYPTMPNSPVPAGFPPQDALKTLPVETTQLLAERETVIQWWQTLSGVS
jgi:ABC-type Fe3+ transport system substrate-binding protein